MCSVRIRRSGQPLSRPQPVPRLFLLFIHPLLLFLFFLLLLLLRLLLLLLCFTLLRWRSSSSTGSLLSPHSSTRVLIGPLVPIYQVNLYLPRFTFISLVLLSFAWYYLVLQGFTGFYWVLPSFT